MNTFANLREDFLHLFQNISDWCDDTFGEKREHQAIQTKTVHEVEELGRALNGFIHGDVSAEHVREEIVDVMITLINQYSRVHDNLGDMYTDISQKFQVLQQRSWKRMDDGTFRHHEGFSYVLHFTGFYKISGMAAGHDQDKIIWYLDLMIPDSSKWDASLLKEHMEQLKPDLKWEAEWLAGTRYRLKILTQLTAPISMEVAFPFPIANDPGVVEKA